MGNVRHGTYKPLHRVQAGFTLVELMVVVALVAIVALIATPSWQALQRRNAVRALVNDYTLSIYFAQTEAVRQNSAVTICPSNNGTSCTDSALENGWIVMVGLPNAAAPTILQDTLPRNLLRTAFNDNQQASRAVTFLPNGQPAANFAGNTLRVCPTSDDFASLSREVAISRAGRISVTNPGVCNIPA
jgi:type IV fimbrial biogenesis protein FimT